MQDYNLGPFDPTVAEITQAEREKLADLLFEIGAVKFGAFRIKLHQTQPDAPLSPLYLNLRLLRSYPAVLAYVTALLDKLSKPLVFDLMADIPTAATPLVTLLSYFNGRPMISPRKETKSYGLEVSIDGAYQPGQRVLLIDDLVSQGGSKFEALATLEQAGLVVQDLMMVVNREQGGAELLEATGYKLHFVVSLSQLLARYRNTGAIDQPQYQAVCTYIGIQSPV